MRFSVSAGLTVATRVTGVLLMGISSIFVARLLGPAGQGVLASLIAVVAIAQQFGHLGIYASIIRFVGADKSLYRKACGNSLTIGAAFGLALTLILVAVAIVYPAGFGGIDFLYIAVYSLAVPFSLLIILFQGVLLSVNRIKEYNLFIFTRSFLIFAGSIIISYLFHLKVLGFNATILSLIVYLVSVEVFTSILYVGSTYLRERFKPQLCTGFIKKMMGYGIKVYVATSLTILVFKFDIVLVNYFLGSTPAGLYSVSAKIAELLYMAPATIALIFFPAATRMGEKSRPFAKKVLVGVSVLMAIGSIIALALAKPIVTALFGPDYSASTIPFMILVPGIFFISIETILMNYYASRNMPLFAVLTPFIGLASNIILNIILIPRYGINAAAATSTFSYALMFFMFLAYFIKEGLDD